MGAKNINIITKYNMKRFIYVLLVFGIFVTSSQNSHAQNFDNLPLKQQIGFFEGYWKYNSPERDTIFIIKLKVLERTPTFVERPQKLYAFSGTYLYYNKTIIENNIHRLDPFMNVDTYEEYERIKMNLLKSDSTDFLPSIYVDSWEYDMKDGFFSDKTNGNINGVLTLSVCSAKKGNESIKWNLELKNEIIWIMEGENVQSQTTFSVPTNIILQKMHNLQEFEDKGIYLSPFAK